MHVQQLVEANIYTHMHINPLWIYWLHKISWLSDINFAVFVLQIILLHGWAKQPRRHCSVESEAIVTQSRMWILCGITAEAGCVEKGSDVEHPPLGVRRVQSEHWGRRLKNTGCIFLHIYAYSERRKIDRRFIIPWFLWNMHWNVNEYNKFTFNGLPGN